ncbi:MAG: hypothetical protein M3Y12_00095, partial [Bacteroidota bacterium]|nr:hypothetical protein [Bacteroidota bacterium]
RDNAPSEPDYPFAIEHIPHPSPRWAGTDEVQAAYLRTDAKHQRTLVSRSKIWGLSDGKEMLIAYQGSFYKLRPAADGRNFTFLGPPLFDEQTASKVAAAAVVGGALGAAIVGAAANAEPPTLPYEIHLASGRVLPVPEAGQPGAARAPKPPDTARVYVFRRADSPKDRAVALHVNGQAGQALPACQWVVLRWTDRRQEMSICAQPGAAPDNCHRFVPDFSQPNYFECVVPADGSPPTLVPVAAKAGAFEIRRIRLLTANRR